MDELLTYFNNNEGNLINKWLHYFETYETYFEKYKNKEVVILEIGVYQGGSLKMWRHYFGDNAKIYAIDINPLCKQFEEENVEIFIGSQSDREFLKYIKSKIPKVDILIDDGGHSMNQQTITFEELYDHIKDEGVYLCEDLHTSYWNSYGGGYKRKGTFIEYSKNFIDYIHGWYTESNELTITDFTQSTFAIHYYDSILVIEKRKKEKPISKMTGIAVIDEKEFLYDNTQLFPNGKIQKQSFIKKLLEKIRFIIYYK